MPRISWLSKQLRRQESAYTKVKEQKTKEKLFSCVRKLIALLRFPQQEVLRSGSQIPEETNSQGRRNESTSKGNPTSDAGSPVCGYACCGYTRNFILWRENLCSSLDWMTWIECENLQILAAGFSASCTAATLQLLRAEKGFAGLTQNWAYCRTNSSHPWIYQALPSYSTTARLTMNGKKWSQNKH